MEWFVNSLLPTNTKYVAKGGVVTEEKIIARAQCIDIFYFQYKTLYNKIPNAPCPLNTIPLTSTKSHDVYGVIGSINQNSVRKLSGHSNTKYIPTIVV